MRGGGGRREADGGAVLLPEARRGGGGGGGRIGAGAGCREVSRWAMVGGCVPVGRAVYRDFAVRLTRVRETARAEQRGAADICG